MSETPGRTIGTGGGDGAPCGECIRVERRLLVELGEAAEVLTSLEQLLLEVEIERDAALAAAEAARREAAALQGLVDDHAVAVREAESTIRAADRALAHERERVLEERARAEQAETALEQAERRAQLRQRNYEKARGQAERLVGQNRRMRAEIERLRLERRTEPSAAAGRDVGMALAAADAGDAEGRLLELEGALRAARRLADDRARAIEGLKSLLGATTDGR